MRTGRIRFVQKGKGIWPWRKHYQVLETEVKTRVWPGDLSRLEWIPASPSDAVGIQTVINRYYEKPRP